MQAYSINLLRRIKQHLKQGGVIAYPTEFCYGLGCDPSQTLAIAKILKLKRRNKAKGLILIAAKIKQLDNFILPLSTQDKEKVKQYWPGFYSLLLPSKHKSILTGKHTKLSVRVSSHPLVKQLCNYLNMPLVSTSANLSGYKPIKNYSACLRQFGHKVMVLPGSTKFAKHPSTILDLASGQILR